MCGARSCTTCASARASRPAFASAPAAAKARAAAPRSAPLYVSAGRVRRGHIIPAMRRERTAISPIAEIIGDLRAGNIVILVDDEDRENEGDLVFAADFVSAEKVNFLARHGRGLICMPVLPEHAAQLGLKPMVSEN